MRHLLALVLVLGLLPGCIIIFADDDGSGGGGGPVPDAGVIDAGCAVDVPSAPEIVVRDPITGQCQPWQPGPGGGCWGTDPIVGLDWAECNGFCETLDEATCVKTDGCRAAYVDTCPFCDVYPPPTVFAGCWGTAPSGPVRGTPCEGLDASECSRHDDCSPVHSRLEAPGADGGFMNALGEFELCMNEKTAVPPPACEALLEPACIARNDCEPQYQGIDCSCQPSGCTCADWQYLSCSQVD